MADASSRLEEELKKYVFHPMKCTVLSNVTGRPYQDEKQIPKLLKKQLTSPVRWMDCMGYLKENGYDHIVDLGSGTMIKNLARQNFRFINAYAFQDDGDVHKLNQNISDGKDNLRAIGKCLALAAATRNRRCETTSYDERFYPLYKEIMNIYEELEEVKKEPSDVQIQKSLDMLNICFTAKGIAKEEQNVLMMELFHETGLKVDNVEM